MKRLCFLAVFMITTLTAGVSRAGEAFASALKEAGALPGAAAAAPEPGQPKALKEWTIMIYMNGKNNLGPFVHIDMNEMENYGPAEGTNVVIQAARRKEQDAWQYFSTTDDFWSGTRRYLLKRDGALGDIASELLQKMRGVDMGDWRRLEEFGRWAKENYPAKRYMLIVWNHGTGWLLRDSVPPGDRSISSDDETRNAIDVPDLARAIRGMGGVDIYASDACLMQMAEVVYELRGAAGIVVGSEFNEPENGWSYLSFLGRVHSNSANLTPEVLAAAAVQGYGDSYMYSNVPVTMSAVRTAGVERLRALLDEWALQAMKEDRAELARAWQASLLTGERIGSRDLAHFMTLVHGGASGPELKALSRQVLEQYYSGMLIQSFADGKGRESAGGLAVYMPSSYDPTYGRLAWARDGRWDDFLRWIMGV